MILLNKEIRHVGYMNVRDIINRQVIRGIEHQVDDGIWIPIIILIEDQVRFPIITLFEDEVKSQVMEQVK